LISFHAQDGWVIIAVGNDSLWKRFCQAAGMVELLVIPL
jgi:crotonobetainyl-CoA:carnitine CoA-transferase CaiB-like acyl-CoA transferase